MCELLLDEEVERKLLLLDPELNHERDELLVDPTRTASIAFVLGRGRPSVRLAP